MIQRQNGFEPLEIIAYILLAGIIGAGYYFALTDETYFRTVYVVEDGVIEYCTAAILAVIGLIYVLRLVGSGARRTRRFTVVCLIVILLMFFGAGEEISWGQRIFGITPAEFFSEHNRQNETNLHNLTVAGVNINKLIFGKILTLFLVLFYLVLPSLAFRSDRVHALFSHFYIPIPKIHHGIVMLLCAIGILLVASSKRGELNEIALVVFFLLTVLYPQNRDRLVP